MDLLTAFIILIILIAIFGSKKGKSRKRTTSSASRRTKANSTRKTPSRTESDPYKALQEHWLKVSEGSFAVPKWYNDPVTERQLTRIKEEGITLPRKPISKGQASDLIGLSEAPESNDLEILRFFKITGLPLKHRSIAQITISRLLDDPNKSSQWINRPATAIQKEYYRHFGLKAPKGLTASEAEDMISSNELTDEQDDEWFLYSNLIEELQDKDFRDDYDLKKPSIPIIRQAVQQHTALGTKITNLSADDLVETLLEIKPDLQKD